jgi:hypothetical protein
MTFPGADTIKAGIMGDDCFRLIIGFSKGGVESSGEGSVVWVLCDEVERGDRLPAETVSSPGVLYWTFLREARFEEAMLVVGSLGKGDGEFEAHSLRLSAISLLLYGGCVRRQRLFHDDATPTRLVSDPWLQELRSPVNQRGLLEGGSPIGQFPLPNIDSSDSPAVTSLGKPDRLVNSSPTSFDRAFFSALLSTDSGP